VPTCNYLIYSSGGEGGIRTPDTLSGMPVFKTGAINHSATSPLLQFYYSFLRAGRAYFAVGAGLACSDEASASGSQI
jgi:hypothetical protein